MNEIIKKNSSYVEVHQCLFGYQEGHRLLSSSLKLPEEATSMLLLLSDLVPGLSLPMNGGYWTGIPLPSAKSYALMRTWLAPEMPRPGCVWTHVLIIAFADIARFPDFSVLIEYVTRPNVSSGFEIYSAPILLSPPLGFSALKQQAVSFSAADAHRVVQAIYEDQGTGKVIAPLDALNETIFAVWSQQWPRLRRSFSFRTAASLSDILSTTKRFDLSVFLGSDQDQTTPLNGNAVGFEAWEKACIDDLLFPHNTDFRRFLWRYGSDVHLGRSRFKFLANMYLATRLTTLGGKNLHRILTHVTTVLKSPEDGRVLKEDLVERNQYSLLPLTDSIDMLAFYVNDPIALKLPPLSAETFEAIHHCWPTRSEEILSIAEAAAERGTNLGIKLLDRIAAVTEASTFFSSTATRPNLRNKLLASNPSLLDSDELVKVSNTELLMLIEYVPDNNQVLIDHILLRLLVVDDTKLAVKLVERFPNSAIATVIEAIELFLTGRGMMVPQSWIEAIKKQSTTILHGGFIEQARTTSALAFLASMLGYIQPATLQAGPMPWVNGINNARDDLGGFDRQKFLVFLLTLALQNPVSGCEPLFEIAFNPVHNDLRDSKLNWEQTSNLLTYLPRLGWLKNWDKCLRLRIGIVDAYVTHNLDPKSFKQLTTNADLHKDLIELADNSNAGHKFLKQVRHSRICDDIKEKGKHPFIPDHEK